MKEKFSVTGMTCSACSSGIEKRISKLDGVKSAEVSLMGEFMTVEYVEGEISSQKIIDEVVSLGYGATIFDENILKANTPKPNLLKKRFFISLALLLPLVYLSMGGMLGVPLPNILANYTLQAVLSACIVIVNFKFFSMGTRAVFKGAPNMDTLVAMGSAVSYIYSFVLTVFAFFGTHNGHGAHLFYESAAMILTLVTLGKWLEEKSKRKTGEEIEKLIKLMPNTVTIFVDGLEKSVPFSSLTTGDILIVRQGDYIPVDGEVVQGDGFIDRAAITGESMPVEVEVGDQVTGADIVKSGYLQVRAEKVGKDTTLSQIVKMVKEAGASKAPIQQLADKIAGVFVPVVVALATVAFALWLIFTKDFSLAANYGISLLVISCPCSLGLATPVAVMAATGRGMSLGILFKDAETLQKAKNIDCVLLDKTATLTVGEPKVTDFELFNGGLKEVLSIAYLIESRSNHPIAERIKEYALEGGALTEGCIDEYDYETGKGARAKINRKEYLLGNRKLLPFADNEMVNGLEVRYSNQGKTVVYLASENDLLAVFALADILKETSENAITELKKRNISAKMITGDIQNVAKAIADKVGLEEFFAETLPQDKAEIVDITRNSGKYVAFVGDGINDSPALKSADVGVAMGTGTDIAIDSADVVLVSGDLRSVATMIDLSKETVKNVKQNLFWAFFYNCVAIPIAGGAFAFAGITLNPMIAAGCMSLSSLFVVSNALRLTRFGKNKHKKGVESMNDNKKTIKIEGMMCSRCVAHVTKALQGVDGVTEIDVNLKKKTATVKLDKEIDNSLFVAVITDAGYEVKKIS